MKHSGSADLPLMGGVIPSWLFERMTKLSLAMVEVILEEYGKQEFIRRMSDPFWFQSFGAVIGMDWNSSGVTTAVLRALKKSINPRSKELGIYIGGGKGKQSLQTPKELIWFGEKTGLDGNALARSSRLTAKVDNTAIQDGHQLYIHSFVISNQGDWTVIQQGMNTRQSSARRYHWHSKRITSFVEEPHTAICGDQQGEILNLVDKEAKPAQNGIMDIVSENPEKILKEIPKMILPHYKEIKAKDINHKRLGSILWLAQENQIQNFEDLLLLRGLGSRTLQSLTLVSEIIHGTPSRFKDPARFSFAHGAKNGKPMPVLTKVYDESINTLRVSVERAKIGNFDRQKAIKKLTTIAQRVENDFIPNDNFEQVLEKENKNAWRYGGRTHKGFSQKPKNGQLGLFD